jgi:hypothetical protein
MSKLWIASVPSYKIGSLGGGEEMLPKGRIDMESCHNSHIFQGFRSVWGTVLDMGQQVENSM